MMALVIARFFGFLTYHLNIYHSRKLFLEGYARWNTKVPLAQLFSVSGM
jgi:hypothetical protein